MDQMSSGQPDGLAPEGALAQGRASIPIVFASLAVTLDGSGAAWLPAQSTLIVSDLHLEKGSSAAARGALVPALDSHDTLLRLKCVIEAYRPKRVVCLGDSFHDGRAGQRMSATDRKSLAGICELASEWVWIRGNHDRDSPDFCDGERRDELEIEGVILRHEPTTARDVPEIAGHFHPKASVSGGGTKLSGRCFCVFDDLLLMPAFGTFTGGLSCKSQALRSLHEREPRIFMLHGRKIWRIA